jgi:hypothetical protein
LIDPKTELLKKLLNMIKLNIINSDKLNHYELLEFWLKSIGDSLSLFLLKKVEKKNKFKTNTINLLVKSKQAIKEINQNHYDIFDIIEKIKNSEYTMNIFIDSLNDYFKLRYNEEKELPLNCLNFKNILNEFTKNVENIKKREEPKLQSSRLLGRSSNKMKRVETRIKNLETIKNKLEGLKLVI